MTTEIEIFLIFIEEHTSWVQKTNWKKNYKRKVD